MISLIICLNSLRGKELRFLSDHVLQFKINSRQELIKKYLGEYYLISRRKKIFLREINHKRKYIKYAKVFSKNTFNKKYKLTNSEKKFFSHIQ